MISVNYNGNAGGMFLLVWAAIVIMLLISMWKIFEKAGEHGWAIFVPFYGNYCQFRMAFGSGWMFLLMFVPLVNFVVAVMLYFKLAKAFGKGVGFGFGLMFLPFVFFPLLAFGDAEYVGP